MKFAAVFVLLLVLPACFAKVSLLMGEGQNQLFETVEYTESLKNNAAVGSEAKHSVSAETAASALTGNKKPARIVPSLGYNYPRFAQTYDPYMGTYGGMGAPYMYQPFGQMMYGMPAGAYGGMGSAPLATFGGMGSLGGAAGIDYLTSLTHPYVPYANAPAPPPMPTHLPMPPYTPALDIGGETKT